MQPAGLRQSEWIRHRSIRGEMTPIVRNLKRSGRMLMQLESSSEFESDRSRTQNDGPAKFIVQAVRERLRHRCSLRPVREMVDIALSELSGQFESMYADTGRRSIPPEKLLRALLLQILYSIRSERMLCEQLDYNLLFRWFIGLSMDDPVWDHSTFSKNRDRLLESDIARGLFDAILAQAEARDLTSDEHFTVDGTLIEAWASLKSVRAKDGSDDPPEGGGRNPERDFHGQKRKNDTHESSTDPESRLYRKGRGKEARFYYMGHVLMENRHGLVVDGDLTEASGTAERDTAVVALSM